MPLRTGAGVKSKVVEALREGLPIVTTSVGAQGLTDIETVIGVADDAAALADAAARLLLDDDLWAAKAAKQIDYARARFSLKAFRQTFIGASTFSSHKT